MKDPEFRELPTPQPLKPGAMGEEQSSFLQRLLARWRLLACLVGIGLVIAVVSGVLLLRGGGLGSVQPKFSSPPSLEELAAQYPQLAGLLTDPTLGSAYKDFLVAYETGGIEAAQLLAAQRGLLNDRDEIRITLVVDSAEAVPALVLELQRVGITVEGSYEERINVGVPLALIQQLAAQQGTNALFEQLTQMGHIIRLELPALRRSDLLQAGSIRGEGVSVTGADAWHGAGFTGQSIRIGVLDLGFDGYRRLLGTELPDSVVARSFIFGKEPDGSGEVHGTACAEIIHEMAPAAELYLASYDGTLVSMGQAVDWLLSQNVHIISNSTSGVVGPMDGSDESAELVDEAVERGVLWVNSSGNAGEEHYRGQFSDADGDGLHEFPDGTEAMAMYVYASDLTLALNWDDWQRVTEDYDLFFYDEQGDLVASSEDIQSGLPGQAAAELLMGEDVLEGIYYVAVKADRVTRAATLDLYTLGATPEFPVAAHSLGSPADARGALSVGATEYRDDSLATYSSQGPSNDGRLKPELSAPAGVSSASYAPDVFEGTSASTPHVAAAAALVWSAFPDYQATQVRDYLEAHALDLGPPGPDNGYGYGRLYLPPPPGEAAGLAPIPTALPTPLATRIPEPTGVAVLPEPADKPGEVGTSRGGTLLLVVALGLLGGVVALGGGGLLLAALLRSPRRTLPAPPPRPVPDSGPWAAAPEPRVRDSLLSRVAEAPGQSYGVLVGGGRGPTVLKSGLTCIGRSTENDLVLDDLLVSRRHARVECAGGRCTVQDLGSANGLFVNGRRVSHTALWPGDRLRLGNVELTYQAGDAPQAKAWLEIGARRYPLSIDGANVGRSRDNDIHLADESASRRHARIALEGGVFVISDLGSANGTYVNGQRIQRRALDNGDEIQIGASRLRFSSRS